MSNPHTMTDDDAMVRRATAHARNQAFVDMLNLLATGTQDAERIGRRVLTMAVMLECDAVDGLCQADIARMFGLSRSTVSEEANTLNEKLSERRAFPV